MKIFIDFLEDLAKRHNKVSPGDEETGQSFNQKIDKLKAIVKQNDFLNKE